VTTLPGRGRRALALLGGWLVLAGGLAGCGRSEAEALAWEQLAAFEEYAGIISAVKDAPSMAAAWDRLRDLDRRMAATGRKAHRTAPPTPSERQRLSEQGYGEKLRAALLKIDAELARVRELPGGDEFVNKLKTSARPGGGRP
jgi:hypothetical protein